MHVNGVIEKKERLKKLKIFTMQIPVTGRKHNLALFVVINCL